MTYGTGERQKPVPSRHNELLVYLTRGLVTCYLHTEDYIQKTAVLNDILDSAFLSRCKPSIPYICYTHMHVASIWVIELYVGPNNLCCVTPHFLLFFLCPVSLFIRMLLHHITFLKYYIYIYIFIL